MGGSRYCFWLELSTSSKTSALFGMIRKIPVHRSSQLLFPRRERGCVDSLRDSRPDTVCRSEHSLLTRVLQISGPDNVLNCCLCEPLLRDCTATGDPSVGRQYKWEGRREAVWNSSRFSVRKSCSSSRPCKAQVVRHMRPHRGHSDLEQ